MSRETEKMFKQLHDYMAQNAPEGMSDEKVESLVNEFIQNYNSHRPDEITEETARTSDDFLELAQDADNEGSALKYARKALKLDPDNLDAEFMVAEIASRDELDLLKKLRLAVRHGEQVMESKGYADEDSIGHYWGITETRPYMRVRSAYMSLMKDLGMFRGAAAECEEMIRLCENDNLGVRYTLMHLYAILEDEQKALELHQKYDSEEETQMLLPLSVLYFKLGDLEKADDYLKRLAKANKDTKKFVKAVLSDKLDQYTKEMSDYGYCPFSIEELIVALMENQELFSMVPIYFYWADKQLSARKKK